MRDRYFGFRVRHIVVIIARETSTSDLVPWVAEAFISQLYDVHLAHYNTCPLITEIKQYLSLFFNVITDGKRNEPRMT